MKVTLHQERDLKKDYAEVHYKEMTPSLEKMLSYLKEEFGNARIYGKTEDNERKILKVKNIFYFESVDKKIFAYLEKEVYQVDESLNKLQEELYSEGFVRINKSNIININHIKAIKPEASMRVRAIMDNDEFLIINRSYKTGFKNYLKERRSLL